MKKILCLALTALMLVAMLASCSGSGSDTIKVGIIGPHSGEYAQYGLAVRNGAELYFKKVNEEGGINGKQIELVIYDNKGVDTEAVNAFTRMADEGICGLIGDVLTSNTIAVVGEANPMNMPMITPSATAMAVTVNPDNNEVYKNVFRTCFIDPFQGEKMAEYASEKMNAKTAAVIFETGNDYSIGLKDAFIGKCAEIGLEVVAEEGFATGDKDFRAQLTNISSKNPDVVFCPAYYETDGLIVTQAREIGISVPFIGGDGWSDIASYASAEDLQGCLFCSSYASGSSDKVKSFETDYIAAYGDETLNLFAANAYDAAMVLVNALKVADDAGIKVGTDEHKQAVIDAIRDKSADVEGITSDGYTFDQYNNPIKDAVIIELVDGVAKFKEIY